MNDTDEFLAHYGKKGMKWGVVNDDDASSSSSSETAAKIKKLSPEDQKKVAKAAAELNKFAEKNGGGAAAMAAKYGPAGLDAPPPDNRNFYQRNKTAINVGVAVGVAGLAAYGGYKYNANVKGKAAAELLRQEAWDRERGVTRKKGGDVPTAAELARIRSEKIGDNVFNQYQNTVNQTATKKFNPDELPNDRISLKAGSVLKRMSMDDETSIRPGGFYASFEDGDVERYKAILPTYWKSWGGQKGAGGHVVNLKASQDIKAPSRREAYDIYDRMYQADPNIRSAMDPQGYFNNETNDQFKKSAYNRLAAKWIDDKDPTVSKYFSEVKKAGYNALIDENDAGTLSKNPLRVLDGSMFTLEPSERLTSDDIGRAQNREAKRLGLDYDESGD